MRRTIIVIMMFYAMLNCIADVSIKQSMYLPSQNVVAEFMAVEPYGGLFGESASLHSYKYSGKELERMNGLNTYDFHARPYYYPVLQFHSPDILGENTPWLSPYLYCAGNPIMLIDPTGNYLESVWDAVNIGMGISSLWNNIKNGNVGEAIVDGAGVVVDVAAILLPGVPGGASTAIRSARAADDVVDAVKTTSKVADKATDMAKAVHGNSKTSTKAQYAYDIRIKETGEVVKTGVSSGPIRKDGKSYRAESQVRKWNKQEGAEIYESVTTHKEPSGPNARDKILKYEKQRADELRNSKQLTDKTKHQRP